MRFLLLLPILCLGLPALDKGELPREGDIPAIRYAVAPPAQITPHLVLILCFHGRTGNETNLIGPVEKTLKGLGLRDGVVILGAKSQGEGWEALDHAPVERLTRWAMNQWPIDPRRVYNFGFSSGGNFSGRHAGVHPERIAAAVIGGSGIDTRPYPTVADPRLVMPGLYMFMGQNDDDAHKSHSRRSAGHLVDLGYDLIYREVPGLGHSVNHQPILDDSLGWLMARRHQQLPPLPADAALVKELDRRRWSPPPSVEECAALFRIGGREAAGLVAKSFRLIDQEQGLALLAAAKQPVPASELAPVCARAADDAKLAEDRAAAAIAVLGRLAAWRQPEAQEALIALADRRGLGIERRCAVVAALAQALHFQLGYNLQDPPLVHALVKLLANDEEAVRRAAHAVLAPHHHATYDAADARAAAQEARGPWQEWALGLTWIEQRER